MIVLASSYAAHKTQPVADNFTPPLDALAFSAQGAWGVRKLRAAYTGSCLRVRRASDNAEQDIGFVGEGHLDKDAITSFCGSAQGLVAKIYDQSGNGIDLTYSSPTSYAEIWTGSAFHTVGSKNRVRIKGMGTQSYLGTASSIDPDGGTRRASTFCTIWLPSSATTLGLGPVIFGGSSVAFTCCVGTTSNIRYRNGSVDTTTSRTITADARTLACWYRSANSTCRLGVNATYVGVACNSTNEAVNGLTLAIWGGWFFTELIHAYSDQSTQQTGMNNNVTDYYG